MIQSLKNKLDVPRCNAELLVALVLIHSFLTRPFTILEPQDQEIANFV